MRVYTMSVIVGTSACNASCPFCISKTTFDTGLDSSVSKIHAKIKHNFNKACICAERSEVQTVLFTGKGEPTLKPWEITEYLKMINETQCKFPFIEIQTNGIILDQKFDIYQGYLNEWYYLGLNTIAISVVHWDYEKNKSIYQPNGKYMDLFRLIERLHDIGFSVRISCMLLRNYIDNIDDLSKFILMCKNKKVEQFTARPIYAPKQKGSTIFDYSNPYINFTLKNGLQPKEVESISEWAKTNCTPLLNLPFGAIVYDYQGQNFCWSNCLTETTNIEEMRQIIFYPDGKIRFSWQHEGAILM